MRRSQEVVNDGNSRVWLDAEYASLDPLRVRIATHRACSEVADDVEARVAAELPVGREFRLLDVGCGTGTFLARLRSGGHRGRLVGLDVAPAAVAEVRRIPDVDPVLGSATGLGFRGGSFDVVTARHMLYHVDDPVRTLREFHRVLSGGGRCVVVVNHAETTPRLMALVRGVARDVGAKPPRTGFRSVHSDNVAELMAAVFERVRVHRHDNALVFTEPEPLIAYAVAVFSMCDIEPGSPHRERAVAAVTRIVRRWFDDNGGPWRDPKGYTVCLGQAMLKPPSMGSTTPVR